MRSVGIHLLLSAASVVVLVGGISAQEPSSTLADARLSGQILDERVGSPVKGVLIRLETGEEAVSDEEGRFRFEALTPGRRLYALLTADCKVTWGQVTLPPGKLEQVSLTVATEFASEESVREEESRRRRSSGKLVTGEDIDAMHAVSMAEVIRRVAPSMVMGAPEEAGAVTQLTSRGSNSIVSRSVPIVVIDGVRLDDGARALDNIQPADVLTLEVLPGAAGGWEFGSSGSGGVIKVTTGRRAARSGGAPRKACVVPDFPGR